ncbi:hypothetical protein C4J81_12510 [Deltaproteobacteria bacterium Smac51]|nr:hypothetical protein C4J81_12510 [Deltaproteobacteria bacterium Smac51]
MRTAFSIFAALLILMTQTAGLARANDDMLPDAIMDPGPRPGHILVVDKAEQILYLYKHENHTVALEKVMSCSTGGVKGDKLVEGDKKTPNGYYIFNQKFLPRELSPIYGTLAYPTDYPNFWDKKMSRGGYGIWLHGINKPLVDYDSNGCIELENADVARMEELIHLFDTPLLTYESLTLKPAAELKAEAEKIKSFLEKWRQAWVAKDHATYRSMYDPAFVNSDGRTFDGWMTNKENVAKNYKNIHVEIKDLKIFRHRDVVVAVFEQDYRGDERFTSIGQKRLYLKNAGNSYKIAGEEFRPLPNTTTNKWLTASEKRLALETPPLTVAQVKPEALGMEAEEIRAATEAKAAAAEEVKALTAEEGALTEGEAKALAKAEAESLAKEEARVKEVAEAMTKAAAEAEARALAEAKAKEEAEAKALAEAKAKEEAEAKALAEAKAKEEAEAKALAEAKAKEEAEAKALAEAKAKEEAEAKALAEAKAKAEAEAKALAEAKAEAEAKALAEAKAKAEAEAKALAEAKAKAEAEEKALVVSRKMAVDAAKNWINNLDSDELIVAIVEDWATAWRSRDLEKYFAFYHPDFYYEDKNMFLRNFKSYKTPLIENAAVLEVGVSDFEVSFNAGTAMVSFRQDYRSDNWRDVGRKTLTLKKTREGWKIVAETWKALP